LSKKIGGKAALGEIDQLDDLIKRKGGTDLVKDTGSDQKLRTSGLSLELKML
jgi:hypothetical protein